MTSSRTLGRTHRPTILAFRQWLSRNTWIFRFYSAARRQLCGNGGRYASVQLNYISQCGRGYDLSPYLGKGTSSRNLGIRKLVSRKRTFSVFAALLIRAR